MFVRTQNGNTLVNMRNCCYIEKNGDYLMAALIDSKYLIKLGNYETKEDAKWS